MQRTDLESGPREAFSSGGVSVCLSVARSRCGLRVRRLGTRCHAPLRRQGPLVLLTLLALRRRGPGPRLSPLTATSWQLLAV